METSFEYHFFAGWHEAADGRGLSELERCKRNYDMLNMILDEWIPWHKENPDLSTVDVNKYVDLNMQVYILNNCTNY